MLITALVSTCSQVTGAESTCIVTRWCPFLLCHAREHPFTFILLWLLEQYAAAAVRQVRHEPCGACKTWRLLSFLEDSPLAGVGSAVQGVPYQAEAAPVSGWARCLRPSARS